MINDLSRSTSSRWYRAYHGNVTEHGGEQSEIEGAHDSKRLAWMLYGKLGRV